MANGALGAEGKTMAVKLYKRAFEHVERLILSGMYPIDGRDAWSEHQPSVQKEDEYCTSGSMTIPNTPDVISE